jgi:diguanylate cyclase (GGDEF)-like protein/PAS domain S-box-containing protein
MTDNNIFHKPSSKASYYDLFERSLDGILLVHVDSGKILESNFSAVKILASENDTEEVLENLTIFDFCLPENIPQIQKEIRMALRRHSPVLFETELKVQPPHYTKKIIASISISKITIAKEPNGNEVFVLQFIIRDITKQKEQERQIELLATTDGLTGLMNIREFKKRLEAEHARSLRYKKNYCIIFSDIDHFKKYNDTHGHPAGDTLLKEYAQVIKSCLRTTDIPARYGGEEFVILLPETNIEDGAKIAERLRATIEKHPFPLREHQPLGCISASIGVAEFPQDGADPAAILKAADDCVYQSKHGGRNRVTVSKGKQAPIVHTEG